MIRLLRTAMSTADVSVAGQNSGTTSAPPVHRAVDRVEVRQHCHPSPHVIEKKLVIYRRPGPAQCKPQEPAPTAAPEIHPTHQPVTIQWPWQVLPYPQPTPPLGHFKLLGPTPDILNKGALIDIFV